MQGGYFGLLKFMRELQDGERFVTVQELGIIAENNQLVTDIMVNIYAVSAK
jgi:type IV pilus assembly protein PilO